MCGRWRRGDVRVAEGALALWPGAPFGRRGGAAVQARPARHHPRRLMPLAAPALLAVLVKRSQSKEVSKSVVRRT